MFNDAIDDQPHSAAAAGFVGMDCNTNPVLLEPGVVADGKNLWCRGDGSIETRPGLKVCTTFLRAYLYALGAANPNLEIYAAGFLDTPNYEAQIFFSSTEAWAVTGDGNDLLATRITVGGVAPTIAKRQSPLVQLVDRLFYIDGTGRITWLLYTAGTWTNGQVTTFSTGGAIPVMGNLVAQAFRLIAVEGQGYKCYASAVGTAHNSADWVSTENIQVGSGSGDPPRTVLATQAGFLTVLNGRSAYQISMESATVASWSSLQVCGHTGCVEGRTAVVIGQDVFFLSRFGVVNLGALADTVSIAPQDTLSYPIQPFIDRINWTYIHKAFATTYDNLYLIALPLDSEQVPTRLFAYHLKLKTWMPPWVYTAQTITDWPGFVSAPTWTGFHHALVTHFADKAETILVDSHGQFLRIDATAESDQTTALLLSAATYDASYVNTPIPAYLRTRSFTHDQPASRKQPFFVETEHFDTTASAVIDTVLLVDGQATVTTAPDTNTVGRVAQLTATGGIQKKRYLLRGQFYDRTLAPYREASVELYCAGSKMSVRAIVLSAFIDPPFFTS